MLQLFDEATRHHDRREEVDAKQWLQVSMSVSLCRAAAIRRFGEIAALLTSACNSSFSSRLRISEHRARGVGVIGEVDLDVIFRACAPRADFRKGVPRSSDDAPAGRGESDRGGVSVPRLARQERVRRGALDEEGMQVFQLLNGVRLVASGIERTLLQACAGASRRNSMRSCRRQRAVVPEFENAWGDTPAAPPCGRGHFAESCVWRRPVRSPARRQSGFQRLRLLLAPGPICACFAAWRNRLGFLCRYRRHVCRGCGPDGAATSSEIVKRLRICGEFAPFWLRCGCITLTIRIIAFHHTIRTSAARQSRRSPSPSRSDRSARTSGFRKPLGEPAQRSSAAVKSPMLTVPGV